MYGKYNEEVGFTSLHEQHKAMQAENVSADNSQDAQIAQLIVRHDESVTEDSLQNAQITQLLARVEALEAIVFKAETANLLNKIENMAEGDEATISFPSDVILSDKAMSVKANTKVTLELNDTLIQSSNPVVDAILVEDGATLVINGNGTIATSNGGDGYPIIANGNLVINGGHFVSSYDANNLANACVYARGNGQIEIYGGRFESVDGSFVLNIKDADRATASIKAMGGEYVNFNPSDNASEGEHTNFVPSGYKVESYVEGDNTIYKVVQE